jgi:hypothetical protein
MRTFSASPPGTRFVRSNRNPRDAWPLQPADLPGPKARAAEPRLAELENNVVFRSMIFGSRMRKVMPRAESGVSVLSGGFLTLVLLALTGPIYFLIAVRGGASLRRPHTRVILYFGFPEVLLRELIDLRIAARTWSLALWGRACSPRFRRSGGVFPVLGNAVALGGVLLLIDRWGAWFGYPLGLPLLGFFAARIGPASLALSQSPHRVLAVLGGRVHRFRRAVNAAENPLGIIYTLAMTAGLLWGVALLVMGVWVVVIVVNQIQPDLLGWVNWRLLMRPTALPATTLLLFLTLGILLTLRQERRVRRDPEAALAPIDEDIEAMLSILKRRFDYDGDNPVIVPRASIRPSGERPTPLYSGSRPVTSFAARRPTSLPPQAIPPDPDGGPRA